MILFPNPCPAEYFYVLHSSPIIIMLICSIPVVCKHFQSEWKTKILKNKDFTALKHSYVVLFLLINVKMPTIVGILTFISRILFMLC